MNIKSTLVAFLVLAVALVAAQRPSGRGRVKGQGGRRPNPMLNSDRYSWELELGPVDNTVQQKAFVNTDTNITVLVSAGAGMADNNMTGSIFFYHPSGLVAFKVFRRSGGDSQPETQGQSPAQGRGRGRGRGRRISRSPCFLSMGTSSFEDIVSEVSTRNASEVPIALPAPSGGQEVIVNATGEPLPRSEVAALISEIRPLGRFCRGASMVRTSVVEAAGAEAADAEGVEMRSVLNLDGEMTIVMPIAPSQPGNGNGEGNGRPRPRPGNGNRPRPGNGNRPRPGNGNRPRPGNGNRPRGF